MPLGSVPHATAVQLEDPLGEAVLDGPLFRYFSPLRGSWWLPGSDVRPGDVLRFQSNEEAYPAMAYGQPRPGVSIHCQLGHVRRDALTSFIKHVAGRETYRNGCSSRLKSAYRARIIGH